jgi:hypothetical protein
MDGTSNGLTPRPRDTAAAAFVQSNEGNPVATGHFFGIDAFAQPGLVRRPAAQSEILTTNNATLSANVSKANHKIGRRKMLQIAIVIIVGSTGTGTQFMKTVRVDQTLNPFPNRLTPLIVLTGDAVSTAQFPGQRPLAHNFIDFRLPTHP